MNTSSSYEPFSRTPSSRVRVAAQIAAALATVGLGAAAIGAGTAWATSDASSSARLTSAQRQVIKEATRQYRDVEAALAAGYLPSDQCAELPGVGGMGFHYVHPALVGDAEIDPTKPEILVYVPSKSGRLELGAVEYFRADADQNLETSDDRPTLMGHGFDGPMPGHEPGMPVHYDLHAWVFEHNPLGELAAWNSRVRCPGS